MPPLKLTLSLTYGRCCWDLQQTFLSFMSPQLAALPMCLILDRLVRICSEIAPEEENGLDILICSAFGLLSVYQQFFA